MSFAAAAADVNEMCIFGGSHEVALEQCIVDVCEASSLPFDAVFGCVLTQCSSSCQGGQGSWIAVLLDEWPRLLHQVAQPGEPAVWVDHELPGRAR